MNKMNTDSSTKFMVTTQFTDLGESFVEFTERTHHTSSKDNSPSLSTKIVHVHEYVDGICKTM